MNWTYAYNAWRIIGFNVFFFFPPVQFSVALVADQAAAASGPSRFRGPSPETEGADFTEQGKDMIQRTPNITYLSTFCVMNADLLSLYFVWVFCCQRLGFSGKKCTQLLAARRRKNPKLHFTSSSD